MTVYVVAGYPRTGTSMMVHAVHAGGIAAVTGDKPPNVRKGHRSQPDSYWQPPRGWWSSTRVATAKGKVVKFLLHADGLTLPPLASGNYRVVVMLRDRAEVVASQKAAYGTESRYTAAKTTRWAGRLAARDDVRSVTAIAHRALILQPAATLSRLGWPLDVSKGAEVVDADWWRFRE